MLAILASLGPWGEAIAKIFGYVTQHDAEENTPDMKANDEARKLQELKDRANKDFQTGNKADLEKLEAE